MDALLCGRTRAEREFQERLLLHLMSLSRTGCWTRTRRSLYREYMPLTRDAAQARQHVGKRSHVGGFFLNPYDLSGRVPFELDL